MPCFLTEIWGRFWCYYEGFLVVTLRIHVEGQKMNLFIYSYLYTTTGTQAPHKAPYKRLNVVPFIQEDRLIILQP